MPAFLWAMLGALAAVSIEGFYRSHVGAAYLSLWPGIVGGIVVNYSVYRLLQLDTLIGAFVLFSWATATFRVGMTWWLGEHVPSVQWVALGLIMLAMLLRTWGR